MGFIDSMKTKFKGKDEEADFEAAFRNGSWPEGVEDFAPLENTGSFLPATYDVDPLADSSLPGNAPQAGGAYTETESVVRGAGRQDAFAANGAVPIVPLVPAAATSPDESVRAVSREAAPAATTTSVAQMPQHLREVPAVPEADNVLEFRPRTPSMPNAESLTDEEFSERLRERREARIAEAREREKAREAARAAEEETHRGHVAAVAGAAAASGAVVDEEPGVLKPGRPVPCLALSPRSYDDIHQIVQCVKAEGRPCVLVLRGCTPDLGQRLVDFAFGLCCGTGADMRTLNSAAKVYGVFPRGTTLTESDKTGLARMGIQIRG